MRFAISQSFSQLPKQTTPWDDFWAVAKSTLYAITGSFNRPTSRNLSAKTDPGFSFQILEHGGLRAEQVDDTTLDGNDEHLS